MFRDHGTGSLLLSNCGEQRSLTLDGSLAQLPSKLIDPRLKLGDLLALAGDFLLCVSDLGERLVGRGGSLGETGSPLSDRLCLSDPLLQGESARLTGDVGEGQLDLAQSLGEIAGFQRTISHDQGLVSELACLAGLFFRLGERLCRDETLQDLIQLTIFRGQTLGLGQGGAALDEFRCGEQLFGLRFEWAGFSGTQFCPAGSFGFQAQCRQRLDLTLTALDLRQFLQLIVGLLGCVEQGNDLIVRASQNRRLGQCLITGHTQRTRLIGLFSQAFIIEQLAHLFTRLVVLLILRILAQGGRQQGLGLSKTSLGLELTGFFKILPRRGQLARPRQPHACPQFERSRTRYPTPRVGDRSGAGAAWRLRGPEAPLRNHSNLPRTWPLGI